MKFVGPFLLVLLLLLAACGNRDAVPSQAVDAKKYPIVVLSTPDVEISQISEHVYVHLSFLTTNDFGKVPCNGMVAVNGGEAIIFDAPTNDIAALALINWIKNDMKAVPKALVVTHFHKDCLGGAKAFEAAGIPTYASNKTIQLTQHNKVFVPQFGFETVQNFQINGAMVEARFFGEGHTKDNVVGYFDKDSVLFGGCLVKAIDADKGFLGDANTAEWSNTITKVQQAYPHVKMVIPGHGAIGDKALLEYTFNLFAKNDIE